MHPAPNLVRSLTFAPIPWFCFLTLNNMLGLSRWEGVSFLFSSLILGNVWIGWIEKTSNDDIARLNSIHELERLLICDHYSVKFLKVL